MKGGYRRTFGGMVGMSALAAAMSFMASKTMGLYERGTANLFKSDQYGSAFYYSRRSPGTAQKKRRRRARQIGAHR